MTEPGSGPDLGSGSWDPPPPLPPLWPPALPPAASTGSAVTQWVIYLLAVVLLLGVPTCVCLTARRALEKRHKRRRRHGRETEARRPQKTRLKPFVEASRMTEAQERPLPPSARREMRARGAPTRRSRWRRHRRK